MVLIRKKSVNGKGPKRVLIYVLPIGAKHKSSRVIVQVDAIDRFIDRF